MSPELRSFYQAIHAWVQAGCPDSAIFYRGCGLCKNLQNYAKANDQKYEDLKDEMEKQFVDRGLDDVYPFNEDANYVYESFRRRTYSNPKRLAWIEEHAA